MAKQVGWRKRLRRWRRALRSRARAGRAFLQHPRRITCRHCGFLALDGEEVTEAARVTLGSQMGPDLKKLWCRRNLWTEYELGYGAPSWDAAADELAASRRDCEGFFPHEPGRSPAAHFDLAQQARERRLDRRDKLVFFLLGALVGLLPWLSERLGL